MTEIKQYSERDAMELDEVGGYYFRHVLAMTAEGLHSKSDIAAELGWRDMQIAALQQQVRELAAENSVLKNAVEQCKEFFKAWVLNRISPYNGAYLNALCAHAIEETPATDAALREIRADGAMACGVHLREWYDYQVEERAEEFAARIRAGEKQ